MEQEGREGRKEKVGREGKRRERKRRKKGGQEKERRQEERSGSCSEGEGNKEFPDSEREIPKTFR